jgi:sucrose phosphorylase
MPPAPLGCAYLNFTASHDGIGMRPAEGLLSTEDQAAMIKAVKAAGGLVSMRALPDGGEAPYELNTTYFAALAQTFDGPDECHIDRFFCSQTIVMSLEGIPAFYIHSMLATPNDGEAVERRGMNRAINRHRWDYDALHLHLVDESTVHSKVLQGLKDRLKIRQNQSAFHPNATQFTVNTGDARIFGIWRQSLDRQQSIFALHNVSKDTVILPVSTLNIIADEDWRDLLSGEVVPDEDIVLAPYQCRWISNAGH